MRRVATVTFLSATIFCLLLSGCRQPRCVLDRTIAWLTFKERLAERT